MLDFDKLINFRWQSPHVYFRGLNPQSLFYAKLLNHFVRSFVNFCGMELWFFLIKIKDKLIPKIRHSKSPTTSKRIFPSWWFQPL